MAARLTSKMESDGVEFESMYETELRYIVRTYVPHLRTQEEIKDIGLDEHKLSWQSGNDTQGRRAVMKEILDDKVYVQTSFAEKIHSSTEIETRLYVSARSFEEYAT